MTSPAGVHPEHRLRIGEARLSGDVPYPRRSRRQCGQEK